MTGGPHDHRPGSRSRAGPYPDCRSRQPANVEVDGWRRAGCWPLQAHPGERERCDDTGNGIEFRFYFGTGESTVDLQGIGQRIRQRREARDLTLEDLAREVNLTQSRLAQIERGDPPRVDRLVAIARVLGCSASELLDETVEARRPPSVEHLGKRIRVRRVELGLNQTQLGEAIGMQFPQLGRIERGRSFMRVEQLVAMARALRCPVGYLLGELPHPEGGWLAESGGKD